MKQLRLARDMVNEPANVVTPSAMAEIAGQQAQKYNLDIKVIDREEMRAMGMGGLLGYLKVASSRLSSSF